MVSGYMVRLTGALKLTDRKMTGPEKWRTNKQGRIKTKRRLE